MKINKLIGFFLLGLLLTSCIGNKIELITNINPDSPQEQILTIWWNRGYYLQENEAIKNIITVWQRQTGNKINLFFISQDDILKDTENAIKAGNPPDIVYGSRANDSAVPRWAWDGKLADVTDVIEPLKQVYSNAALQSVSLYNNKAQKRSDYAIPFKQQTLHIHYWKDLLIEAGFTEEDIPTEWDKFWQFWQQVQDNLRAKGKEDIYSFGFPMSREANDTHTIFEHILDAYDVNLLNEAGDLLLDDPQVRQGVIKALNWYTQFYQQGYVPKNVDNWINSSNNSAFLNRNVILTINPSLSIPGSQREDPEIYYNKMATITFPKEPDGEPLTYTTAIKQIVLLESSPHVEVAKNFLSYLMQPQQLNAYLEASLGRYFPVMPEVSSKPFWNDPADPHISVANQQFNTQTHASYQSLNPAYIQVQSESVWSLAIERMILEGWSAETATDAAFTKIKDIFAQWQR
ncbi:MAG: ABC transporter substrate-binding protein [Microcoleaceae cyanobacterium]